MKKAICAVLAVVLGILGLVATLAWVNNVYITYKWETQPEFRSEIRHMTRPAPAGPEEENQRQIKEFIPALNRFSIDLSTITTFIPSFGLILFTIGFIKILLFRNLRMSPHFPFFKSYIGTTVTLGLIGTVWGLILIGRNNPQNLTINSLIICLNTALYSTLIALLWVFVFVPTIRSVMFWVAGQSPDPDPHGKLRSVLDTIFLVNSAMVQLSNTASAVSRKLKETLTALDEVKERTQVDAFEALKASADACTTAATANAEACESLSAFVEIARSESESNTAETKQLLRVGQKEVAKARADIERESKIRNRFVAAVHHATRIVEESFDGSDGKKEKRNERRRFACPVGRDVGG